MTRMYGVVICPLPITTKAKGRTSPPESMREREGREKNKQQQKKEKERRKKSKKKRYIVLFISFIRAPCFDLSKRRETAAVRDGTSTMKSIALSWDMTGLFAKKEKTVNEQSEWLITRRRPDRCIEYADW